MYYSVNPVGTIVGLLIAVGLAFIPASIARKKGYSYGGFWVFGFFFFLIALIVALCLKQKIDAGYQQTYYPPPGANQQNYYSPQPPPGTNQQNYYPPQPSPGPGTPPYGQGYGSSNDQSGDRQ